MTIWEYEASRRENPEKRRSTYVPSYKPKTATPIRTTINPSYSGGMGAVRATESRMPSDAARYAIDSSNTALSRLSGMGAVRQAEAPVSTSYGGIRATERSMPTTTSKSKSSRSRSSSRSSSGGGSWMDVIAAAARTPTPTTGERGNLFYGITPGQQVANQFYQSGSNPALATIAGLGTDILGAGVAGKGLQLLQGGISRLVPTITPAISGVSKVVSNIGTGVQRAAGAGQGVIGQAANKLSETAYRLGPQISQASRLAGGGGVAGATTKGLFRGTLVPTIIAGGGLGGSYLLSGQGQGQPQGPGMPVGPEQGPTQIDPATESSLIRQIRPSDNFMGGGYGGGQNTMGGMTPTFDQGARGSGMILPPDRSNEIVPPPEQPPTEVAPPPELPPEMPPLPSKQEIIEIFDELAAQNSILFAKLSEQLLGQLDTLEQQLRNQYAQQGSVIDPATEAALKEIRAEVDRRRQLLMEEMNRRGLLQSGIWLQEENRILSNQLTAEEKFLASRVADIQNRMTDALLRLGQERINTMGQLAQNQMQSAQWLQGQQLSALQNLQTQNLQWNQWWQEQLAQQRQEAEKKRQWEAEQSLERAKTIAGWTGTVPEGYPGAGQQTLEARKAQSQANKIGSVNSATRAMINEIPTYRTLQEALSAFDQNRNEMLQQGVDLQAVLSQIYAFFGVR